MIIKSILMCVSNFYTYIQTFIRLYSLGRLIDQSNALNIQKKWSPI